MRLWNHEHEKKLESLAIALRKLQKSPIREIYAPFYDEFVLYQVARELQQVCFVDFVCVGSAFGLTLDEVQKLITTNPECKIVQSIIVILRTAFKKEATGDLFAFLSKGLMQMILFFTSLEQQILSVKNSDLRDRCQEHKDWLIEKENHHVESKYGCIQKPSRTGTVSDESS